MTGHFILVDKKPVLANDLMEWALWMTLPDRHVASTILHRCHVSTVFLGVSFSSPPLLFETMIFDNNAMYSPLDKSMWRCETWEEAEKQHKLACGLVHVKYFEAPTELSHLSVTSTGSIVVDKNKAMINRLKSF